MGGTLTGTRKSGLTPSRAGFSGRSISRAPGECVCACGEAGLIGPSGPQGRGHGLSGTPGLLGVKCSTVIGFNKFTTRSQRREGGHYRHICWKALEPAREEAWQSVACPCSEMVSVVSRGCSLTG